MKRSLVAASALLVLVLAAYSNSLNAAFELDDYHQIVENPYIRDLANVPGFFFNPGMGSGWSTYFGLTGYRPVTSASFAISYAISGYDVAGYHAFNIALHFLNALLVFLAARMLLDGALKEGAYYGALIAAAVFAVHPIQTGAVTYVSGRAVLLASFFWLAGFVSFVRLRHTGEDSGAARTAYVVLGPLCYLLGLMSKEMAVSLPAVMLAYDYFFTLRGREAAHRRRGVWLAYMPYAAALVFFLFFRRSVLGYASVHPGPYGVGEYMLSEARALMIYLRVFLLPVNQNADYALPLAGSFGVHAAVLLALVLAALAYAYASRRKAPAASFFAVWPLIVLAPESTVFSITDIAVEYRMYLASVGLIMLAVIIVAKATRGLAGLRVPAAAALVLMLGLLTFSRNMAWATTSTFWSDVVKKSPWSARAHANLGKALMDEGRCPEAVGEFGVYLKDPKSTMEEYLVLNNLGLCYARMGRGGDAVRTLKAARDIYPDNADAYINLGYAYGVMGLKNEEAEAKRQAERLVPSAAGK